MRALNAMEPDAFVAYLGGVFEHSPWIAAAVVAERPFASVAALHASMVAAVDAAVAERRLALLTSHPELGTRGPLTDASATEQGGMGLDRLATDEAERMDRLNADYRARFGFPFIVAVRGQRDRIAILHTLQSRLANTPDHEMTVALAEVAKIARFRLDDVVADGG